MKKIKKYFIMSIIALTLSTALFSSCQTITKNWGGNTTINLEPNQKLEEITWKGNSLWYLTRPMTENDIAEIHTFQEQANLGVFEGTVTIVETKE